MQLIIYLVIILKPLQFRLFRVKTKSIGVSFPSPTVSLCEQSNWCSEERLGLVFVCLFVSMQFLVAECFGSLCFYLGLIQENPSECSSLSRGRTNTTSKLRKLNGVGFVVTNPIDLMVSQLWVVFSGWCVHTLVLQLVTAGAALEHRVTALHVFLVFLPKEAVLHMPLVFILTYDWQYIYMYMIFHYVWRQFCDQIGPTTFNMALHAYLENKICILSTYGRHIYIGVCFWVS